MTTIHDCLFSFYSLDSQSNDDQSSSKTIVPNSLSTDELAADNCFKNAYYVFRALCKLSDRDIKDKANTDPKYLFLHQFFFFLLIIHFFFCLELI